MIRKTRPRRWLCPYDGTVNAPGSKKCVGRCASKRGKRAASFEAQAKVLHRRVVVPPGTRCFFCGCAGAIQDCHIFQRGANPNPAVKWHPDNGLPGCVCPEHRCHARFDSYELGDRGVIAVRYMGQARYDALQAAVTVRWDRDWPGVIERLQAQFAAARAPERGIT